MLKHDISWVVRKPAFFAYEKTKAQITVTVQLISSFVFATPLLGSTDSTVGRVLDS